MLSRHPGDLDGWPLLGVTCLLLHVHHHAVVEVKIIDVGEILSFTFTLKMGFGMGRGDDGKVSTERRLDLPIKVIPGLRGKHGGDLDISPNDRGHAYS